MNFYIKKELNFMFIFKSKKKKKKIKKKQKEKETCFMILYTKSIY